MLGLDVVVIIILLSQRAGGRAGAARDVLLSPRSLGITRANATQPIPATKTLMERINTALRQPEFA